jgi:hypothetical protein
MALIMPTRSMSFSLTAAVEGNIAAISCTPLASNSSKGTFFVLPRHTIAVKFLFFPFLDKQQQ